MLNCSVTSNSALCPWNFPGKNIVVGCHFLLQGNLPNPGIKPASLISPRLVDRFLPLRHVGSPLKQEVEGNSYPTLYDKCKKTMIQPEIDSELPSALKTQPSLEPL